MTGPRAVRPLMRFLGSPRGMRIDAQALKYTGHSPYSILFRLDMRRPGSPPSTPYRPPLALTTIGHRSGRLHTVGLAYYDIDDGWAVVGSAGGSAREPHWVRRVVNVKQESVTLARATRETYRRIYRDVVALGRTGTDRSRSRLWTN